MNKVMESNMTKEANPNESWNHLLLIQFVTNDNFVNSSCWCRCWSVYNTIYKYNFLCAEINDNFLRKLLLHHLGLKYTRSLHHSDYTPQCRTSQSHSTISHTTVPDTILPHTSLSHTTQYLISHNIPHYNRPHVM